MANLRVVGWFASDGNRLLGSKYGIVTPNSVTGGGSGTGGRGLKSNHQNEGEEGEKRAKSSFN